MMFCASLIYVVLFPLLAVVACAVAPIAPGLYYIVVAGLLGATYFAILGLLYLSKSCWEHIGNHGSKTPRRLREVFEARGLEWLNLVGVALVGTVVAIFLLAGMLPYPMWFLLGAIVIGCSDLVRGRKLTDLPIDLPPPRRNLEVVIGRVPEEGKNCEFHWLVCNPELRSIEGKMELVINHEEYRQARNAERFSTANRAEYARYVLEGFTRSVEEAAAVFRNRSKEQGVSAVQEMEDVVCFTRSIRYASDTETRGVDDWADFPVETLYDQAGDCEDHAILAASILYALGHDVALFWLDLSDSAHLALGYRAEGCVGGGLSEVAEGKAYYYVETVSTQSGDQVGDIATQFLKDLKSAEVILV